MNYMKFHERWREFKVSDLPTGQSEDVKIVRYEVTEKTLEEAKFQAFRSLIKGGPTVTPPKLGDQITVLYCSGTLMMSDTHDEIFDHREIIDAAYENTNNKRILIAGLGLGVVVNALLLAEHVEHIRVLEIDHHVTNLVKPWLEERHGKNRFEIVQTNALDYHPEKDEKYDLAWFDIWPTICIDNLPQIAKLHRRWARRVNWYGSWKAEWLREHRNRYY